MKKWLIAAGKRALHTFCQTAIGIIGSAVVLEEVNWKVVVSATLLATILSILKSAIIGMPELNNEENEDE